MKLIRLMLTLAPAAVICSCGGQVVENGYFLSKDTNVIDAALLSYYLPRGLYTVTATYDDNTRAIKITRSPEATIVPDLKVPPQKVVYRHNEWFDDQASIEINPNGTLKEISTSSKDQTIAVVQAVGQIVQQFGALEAAVKPKVTDRVLAEAPLEVPCKPREVSVTVELTYLESETLPKSDFSIARATVKDTASSDPGATKSVDACRLTLDLSVRRAEVGLEGQFYSSKNIDSQSSPCPSSAVCFRIAGGFSITINANLFKHPRLKAQTCDPNQGDICAKQEAALVAPLGEPLGEVYFNRRPFLENSTTVSFTNGMLTKIVSKNPSAIAAVLNLPIELLKSLTLFVKI